MINLRYHVVSLVGVFLALAIGIAVGASVINQGLVQQQQARLARIERNLDGRDRTINNLRGKLASSDSLYTKAEPLLLAGHLADTSIVLVVPQGVDKTAVSELRDRFEAAGADLLAEIWLSPRMAVSTAADQQAVDAALGISTGSPATARYLMFQALRSALRKAGPFSTLQSLKEARLLDIRNQRVVAAPIGADARIVVVSQPGSDVPEADVLLPVVTLLAADDPTRVVVSELTATTPGLVDRIRSTATLADKVSTVDHVDTAAGRVAVVLAVEDLSVGVVGNYGTATGASGLLPTAAP